HLAALRLRVEVLALLLDGPGPLAHLEREAAPCPGADHHLHQVWMDRGELRHALRAQRAHWPVFLLSHRNALAPTKPMAPAMSVGVPTPRCSPMYGMVAAIDASSCRPRYSTVAPQAFRAIRAMLRGRLK